MATRWDTSAPGAGPVGEQRAGHAPLPPSAGLTRFTAPAALAVLAAVTVGAALGLPGRPGWVLAIEVTALVVMTAGVGSLLIGRATTTAQVLSALIAAGLAGVILALLPGAPGFALVCMVLLSLGMRLRPALAYVTGPAILAAMNLAFLLAVPVRAPVLISQDTAAAVLLAMGSLIRSARVSQAASRAAQTRAEHLLARLRDSQAAQAEAVALTERTRVAREIHDILAHALSGLVLTLDTMELLGRRADPSDSLVATMLEQVSRGQRIARDGLADTRRAIAALRGDELPGPALLGRLVAETAAATSIRATLTVTGPPRPLAPEVGLALYRTAQEALINTAKYAGRDGRAELRLSYLDADVELLVEDTRGHNAAPPGPGGLTFGGYGLTGMRERAELLGGRLTAGPTDAGFRVLLRLPAAARATATGTTGTATTDRTATT